MCLLKHRETWRRACAKWWALFFIFAAWHPVLPAEPGGKLDKVRVQLKWLHQFQFAGYYAAVEKGFYRDAGLDVELIEGKPEVDPAHVVLSGGAEFGVGTPELLLLRAHGEPIVVLGVIFQHSPYVFLALRDSGISDVSGLAGRRLMIEPQSAELYAYLKRENVPASGLQILPHSFSARDLLNKKVDAMSAYVTDEPFELDRDGIPFSTFTPRAAGVDFYGDCFFTTEKQIREHPKRVRAFYKATLKGWDYALKHPEEIIDLIVNRYGSGKSRDALRYEADKMQALMHPEIIPIGYMYPGRWQHIMETYEELGMLKEPVSLKGFLYEPSPRPSMVWLYGVSGGLLVVALVAFGILLPLWRLNARLRREVVQRAVAEEGLRIAMRHAEEANQAKARFLAMVSHEIRTPMNGLMGFARILGQTPLTDEQKDYVRLIATSSDRLLALVNDILDFSKIEAGRVELEEVDFSLSSLVRETVQFFEQTAQDKKIGLQCRIAEDLPGFVRGDAARLRQILLNILGNAVKFTGRGSVSLAVERGGPNHGEIMFEVRDTGPGMSHEQLASAFEPFHQADATVHRTHGGTGLGLPICRNLAELMGGTLDVASAPGEGTVVRWTMPLRPGSAAGAAAPKLSAERPNASWPADLRILVAEDDPVSASLMASFFRRKGVAVDLAQTGRQAVESWEQGRHRLVFMDLQMPEMGGLEAIEEIRKKETGSGERSRIIALTAAAAESDRQACLAAGADDYLTKPVSFEKIEDLLASTVSA